MPSELRRHRVCSLLGKRAKARYLMLLVAMAASIGCQPAAAPPVTKTQGEPARHVERREPAVAALETPVVFDPPPADDLGGGTLIEETWHAYTMQESPVGYGRTTVAKVIEEGRELIRTCSFMHMVLKREGQPVRQNMTLISFDTPEGALVRFESRNTAGPSEVVTTGTAANDRLIIQIDTVGSSQPHMIGWQADWGGFFAGEQSLRREPLRAGQRRYVRCLLPISNMPAEIDMRAAGEEIVELEDGPTRLLKITSSIDVGGPKIETIGWYDERGVAHKQFVPAIGQVSVLTTKEKALAPAGSASYDLLVASTVPLVGQLENAADTQRVVYRARVKSGEIDGLFAECLSQRVKPVDAQTAELTVIAVRPDMPLKVDVEPKRPTDADLDAGSLIQSDDSEVVKLATSVLPAESDPWKVAVALEKFVAEAVQNKNFSQAFATAAEVARTFEGDCTEHAVLLAALCRARGIPARAAFGLVYYPPQQGFAYHMWNEVWIEDRWVPLDGTLGRGGVGGGHIKLADSNLAGASAYSAMLPVIQVFGRLGLEVLSVE